MYCKLLKLSNGETILGYTNNSCNDLDTGFVEVQNPVLVSSVRVPMNQMVVETFVMQTWIKMTSSHFVKIPARNVVVAVDVEERAEFQYKQYLSEVEKNKLTDSEMQQIMSDLENHEEEEFFDLTEDEEDDGRNTDGPTLH